MVEKPGTFDKNIVQKTDTFDKIMVEKPDTFLTNPSKIWYYTLK